MNIPLTVWVARPTTGGEWQYLLATQTQSWWA